MQLANSCLCLPKYTIVQQFMQWNAKAKVGSSTEIHDKLSSIWEAIGFMNEHFALFEADVEAFFFFQEMAAAKVEIAQCRRENEELQKDLKEKLGRRLCS